MDTTTAVSAWVMSGIFDLYFAFSIEGISFNKQKTFYNAMGLEKNYGHKYRKMLKEIKKDSALNDDAKAVLSKSYMRIENISFNGNKFLKALEKIYMESRYPSATPVSRSFYVNKFFGIDPINTSALIDLIYDISLFILKYLKKEVSFLPKIKKIEDYHSKIDSWKRFKRIFFTETDGDIIKYFEFS
jgi:hypothetical protein